MPLLFVLACACFVGSFAIRLIDPLVPAMAADLQTAQANVSLLASAYAIPYALIQPILGPIGDRFGKQRIIKICLFVAMAAMLAATLAPNIEVMFAARVIGGLAGGGIIPLAIALVGDHFPFEKRQVALSQLLTAMIVAILFSTIGSGLVASAIGWRGVFAVATCVSGIIFVMALSALRPTVASPPTTKSAGSEIALGYKRILTNARAYVCYAAVFFEGVLILGLLPFVATLLAARGAGGTVEAGFVLAGMAIGGLLYTQLAARFIGPSGSVVQLIRLGGLLAAIGYGGIAMQGSWPLETIAFALVGFGFYAIHNSLQTQATELAPDHRGAAVALHAFFFFLGQSVGPLFYAALFAVTDPTTLLLGVGLVTFCLAMLLAFALRNPVRTAI